MTIWTAESGTYAADTAAFIKSYERRYPLHRYYVFSNTIGEVERFRQLGIKAFFGHHNSLIDPGYFKVLTQTNKDLLAVYTAGLDSWKRHDLCSKLESVGLPYWSYGPDKVEYFDYLRKAVPGARFINEEVADPPHSCLLPPKVNEVLNRAHVGLCLSEMEGGMHGSIEYLLAGLPVVSTPSLGGRDVFFHQDYCEIVEPSPEAVAAGVERLVRRAVPPEEIRSRTIALQQKQIDAFIALMDRISRADGGTGYDRAQWDACYLNKLLRTEPLDIFLKNVPRIATRPLDRRTRVRRMRKVFARRLRNLLFWT